MLVVMYHLGAVEGFQGETHLSLVGLMPDPDPIGEIVDALNSNILHHDDHICHI